MGRLTGCRFLHVTVWGRGELDRRDILGLVHGRSRMTIDPRIPTMRGRSMSGFRRVWGKEALLHVVGHRPGEAIESMVVVRRARDGYQWSISGGKRRSPHPLGEAGHHLIHESVLRPMTAPRACVEGFRAEGFNRIYAH